MRGDGVAVGDVGAVLFIVGGNGDAADGHVGKRSERELDPSGVVWLLCC
jgi:hypothetical protein